MTTRKLPSDWEENPSKRRRRIDDVGVAACFDVLPSDCKVSIFSFLPLPDLNTVALCSKGRCEVRNNASLDQARVGTIVSTQHSTPESLNNAVIEAEENDVFSGNFTYLKIDGVDGLNPREITPDVNLAKLTGVKRLQIVAPTSTENPVHSQCVGALIRMCPNATDLDLNNVKVVSTGLFYLLGKRKRLRNVERLTWKGYNSRFLRISGVDLAPAVSLTELYLDDTSFDTMYSHVEAMKNSYGSMKLHDDDDNDEESRSEESSYLLQQCPNLQRVSLKGATVHFDCESGHHNREPLPQEFIIMFARLHPTLRWFRSDLSEENVAMLKVERPDITFCV